MHAARRAPAVEVVGEAANGKEAVELVRRLRPDLLFLDVQMPDQDGFGVLEALGDDVPRGVVFVTAHDEHAMRAFEVHALDYVLKPFGRPRFDAAVTRALERLERDGRAHAAAHAGQHGRRPARGHASRGRSSRSPSLDCGVGRRTRARSRRSRIGVRTGAKIVARGCRRDRLGRGFRRLRAHSRGQADVSRVAAHARARAAARGAASSFAFTVARS